MAWQPQEDGLKQLAEYLRDSLGAFDRPKQKQAEIVSEKSSLAFLRSALTRRLATDIIF
jgi:hypothetical protein